ncbi:MAG: von Willebrand factor type A domain-containing protein [Vicinamibacterales bacterium]
MRRKLAVVVAWVAVLAAVVAVAAQVRLGSIAGVVRDAQGLAAASVPVVAVAPGGVPRRTVTDAAGRFRFADLPPAEYRVTALVDNIAAASTAARVTAGAVTELALALPADRRLREQHPVPPPPPVAPTEQARTDKMLQNGVVGAVAAGILGGTAAYAPAAMPAERFNTEAYARIEDNGWNDAGRTPLSTFSIDVDTASYANVRRMLAGGAMPPKDAVRVEELLNYFSYDYALPDGAAPFAVTTQYGDAPWNPKHRLALIGLRARPMDDGRMPARNLVFLIDVSGSMQAPNKLALVKASLAMLARNLGTRDRVSIVVYAGAAGLVLPPTSGADTSTVLAALARLEAGGSTNGAQGIRLAYEVARQHFITGGVNRVVLATDGDFNVGTTSEGELTRLIEEQRASGVALSVLGFGMGNLKDSTMEKLADKGDGNYAYIDTLSEAQKVLVEEAGGTLVTVAKDVKLQVEFNPAVVSAYRLIGYENRLLQDKDFNDDRKDAGDMGAGHSVTALYELVPVGETLDLPGIDPLKYQRTSPAPRGAHSNEAMTVKVRYKLPEASTSTLMSVAVANTRVAGDALEFASAVAEFGMLLRDSAFKGASNYADVRQRATRARGADQFGHRAEFIRIVGAAEALAGLGRSHD